LLGLKPEVLGELGGLEIGLVTIGRKTANLFLVPDLNQFKPDRAKLSRMWKFVAHQKNA
jgi:hypothetical protein